MKLFMQEPMDNRYIYKAAKLQKHNVNYSYLTILL
jgi:hypothetical protein